MANKHDKTKLQGGGKIKVVDKAKRQLIGETERLRQKADKLRQEKTALERAEEALRESEARYQTILESVVEGYYEVDLTGNFTLVNDAVCHNLGYSRDELIGMNNRDYMDKQTARKVLERYAEVYTTGQPARGFEFEVIRKNGTKLVTSSSVSLITDSQGQPTGFRGIVRNVTAEKQVEEMLRRSEEKYRNLFETATDGIFTLDLKTRFTSGNKRAEEMCGYNRGELIGKYATVILSEEEIPRMADAFKRVLKGEINTYETKIITKSGELIPVEVTSSPIEIDGEIIGTMGIARDITERKQMEAERAEMKRKAQLATRLSTIGEMASGIVHEINNPLASVVGFAEMLAQKKDLPEDAREYATIINKEGKRVANIAVRLLTFAHHQKPETLYTDINKLIEDTIDLQSYEMETGNIKVTANLDLHLPRTMVDPSQLQQVFLNIMLNARTEMRAAHGGGKLSVKTQALDDTIRISFEDDGPGIAKENLQTLFNPFFTTRKADEGMGLGLSICRGIISKHNGKIYAESTLGNGATFIIELPVVALKGKAATTAGANPNNV